MKNMLVVSLSLVMILWVAGDYMLQIPMLPPPVLHQVVESDDVSRDTFPLPSSVTCGGYKYKIGYQYREGAFGSIDRSALRIWIRPGMPLGRERETLYHELCHCAMEDSVRFTELDIGSRTVSIETDDQWIEATAPNMVRLLRENPQVTSYLLERKIK